MAASAAGWHRPSTLSEPGNLATYPAVGFDGHGDATAVWAEEAGAGLYRIMSAGRRAGSGPWSAEAPLSPKGLFADFPRLAVTGTGRAVAVWEAGGVSTTGRPPPSIIQGAVRPSARAAWGRPILISEAKGGAFGSDVAVDAAGDATAIWSTGREVAVAHLGAGKRRFGAPVVLSRLAAGSRSVLSATRVASDPQGDVLAVWTRYLSGGVLTGETDEVLASVRRAGSRQWGTPERLGMERLYPGQGSASPDHVGPDAAFDGHGDAVVVFQEAIGRSITIDEATSVAPVGHFDRPRPVARAGASEARVAGDGGRGFVLVWQGGNGSVQTAHAIFPGGWSRPRRLAAGGGVDRSPTVAVNRQGEALATWAGATMTADLGATDGRWGPPEALLGSNGGGVADGGVSPGGTALVVWQEPLGQHSGIVIRAALRPN